MCFLCPNDDVEEETVDHVGYLRTLLVLEQSKLDNLTKRDERWPTLKEAIAYRTGRVEAYKELIEFLSTKSTG